MKILETERLILREVVESDDAFTLDLLNQPSFIKYIGDRNVRSLEDAREFIESRYRKSYAENGFGLWAVDLKENFVEEAEIRNPTIGICGFVKRDTLPNADLGFAFLPQFEKKGYALESARAVLEYGVEKLQITRVLAITTHDNASSIRLLEKLGFKLEGTVEQPHSAEELNLFSIDVS